MPFVKEIERVLILFLIAFTIVAVSAAYWAVTGNRSILLREDNPRLLEAERRIQRGSILDRNDRVLAETTGTGASLSREYHSDGAAAVTGYYSLRYGVGGAEAIYDEILRGDTIDDTLERRLSLEILHKPQIGSDIRLSVDTQLQNYVYEAMAGHQGAAVILHVPSGEILAMNSAPSFDPNTLDQTWDELIDAPSDPFFNRVLQGRYQPGGMLQLPLMAAAILTQQNLDIVTDGGNSPIEVDNFTIECAINPPQSDITLRQAYAYGCPYPFALMPFSAGQAALVNILNTFNETQSLTIQGLETAAQRTASASLDVEQLDDAGLVEEVVGQGSLTINPLSMAAATASLINGGNAPTPVLLLGTRSPNADSWTRSERSGTGVPLMTAQAANQLADIMRQNTSIRADNETSNALSIGSHVATALSGDASQVWYIGFTHTAGSEGLAVALVLEDTDAVETAAQIGHNIITAAASMTAQPTE